MNAFWQSNLSFALASMFATLSIGSVLRLASLRNMPEEKARDRRQSLLTWWILALLLAVAVTLGPLGICLLLGLASWVSLDEYKELALEDQVDRRTVKLVFLLIPLTYAAVYFGQGPTTLMWLPLASLLLVAAARIVQGETAGYVRATGSLVLGAVLLIFGPAHAALLLSLGDETPLEARGAGWFIYLVVLTEMNDIAQAVIGRRFGRRKITPRVSPNKTWEGFLGGLVATCLIAVLTAPVLTPLGTRLSESGLSTWLTPHLWPLLAGLVIAVAGFLGDLNMSAIKRDVGVKDSSDLLPGMGGALDRIDSLTLTAPCFYWLIVGAI